MKTHGHRSRPRQYDLNDPEFLCLECTRPECDEDDAPKCAYVRAHDRAQLARKWPWLWIELPKSARVEAEAPSIAKHPRMMPPTAAGSDLALCARIGAETRADKWRDQ